MNKLSSTREDVLAKKVTMVLKNSSYPELMLAMSELTQVTVDALTLLLVVSTDFCLEPGVEAR